MRTSAIGCAVATAVFAYASGSRAADDSAVKNFYSGKKLDFIVGAAAGGGYGVYADVLARHLGDHIPGRPQVVVEIMDGAGSLTAANHLYNQAPRDGTTFGAVFTGAIVEPLIGDKNKARYDARRFGYIGSANRETAICYARPELGFASWKDAFAKPLIVGGAGWDSSIRQYPVVLDKILGMKFKVIPGYPGSSDAVEAVERGEVQGTCGIQWSSFAPGHEEWLKEKKVKIFGQIAAPPGDPTMNQMGVQNIWDVVQDPGKKETLELIFDQMDFGRPYLTPPGVPPERLAALRAAFDATMRDPAFLADAARARLPISPMSGADVQKEVDRLYQVPERFDEEARAALQ
jgi:tripartite-type tricarboxylate transporter receptor subunit TctC